MIRRARTWSAVALVAIALTEPVFADDSDGVNTGYAGVVYSLSDEASEVTTLRDKVASQCSYALTSETEANPNRVTVVAVGGAVSTPVAAVSPPIFTGVKCEIFTTDAQGNPVHYASNQVGLPTAASATKVVASGWPLSPITVCVSGYAIFGPVPHFVEAPRKCRVPVLL